jgi:hypothetical protein
VVAGEGGPRLEAAALMMVARRLYSGRGEPMARGICTQDDDVVVRGGAWLGDTGLGDSGGDSGGAHGSRELDLHRFGSPAARSCWIQLPQ